MSRVRVPPASTAGGLPPTASGDPWLAFRRSTTTTPRPTPAPRTTSHQRDVGRITNMKRTLLHSLPAFHALMEWYPLRDTVQPFLGERLTHLFAHAVSTETDCLICSTFFRRLLIESGENPDALELERPRPRGRGVRPPARPRRARRVGRAVRGARPPLHAGADRGAHRVRRASCSPPTCSTTRCGWTSTAISSRSASRSATRPAGARDGAVRRQGRAHHRRRARPGPRRRRWRWPGKARGSRRSTSPARWPTPATASARATISPASPRRAAPGRRVPDLRGRRPRRRGGHAPPWTRRSRRFGRIDILFNNAGICAYGLAHELTEEAWDAMLDINLKGSWLVARRVIPVMIRQRSGRHPQQLERGGARGAWAGSATTPRRSGA